MTADLYRFLQNEAPLPISQYPPRREGRLTLFKRQITTSLGRPVYEVRSSRGGFLMGKIEFRNQWQTWSYIAYNTDGHTPMNLEILGEIYAMLKLLRDK